VNDHKTSQNIKKLVVDAVKEGIQSEDLVLDSSPFWFRYFNYLQDPLESFTPVSSFTDENIELFVNRQSEIKVLSNYIGKAKNLPFNLHIAVIGSKGIGKHTTLKIITRIIMESFPDISYEFYNLELFYDYKASETLSNKQINEIDTRKVNVRIVSCEGKNKWLFLKRIKDFKKSSNLIISIWNLREYPLEQNLYINRQIFFRNYSQDDIIEIFDKRIIKYLELTNEPNKYYEFTLEELIPRIAREFQGNLNICFKIFKEVHQQTIMQNLRIPVMPLIEQIIGYYSKLRDQKITTKEYEIIDYYLNQYSKLFVTTSDLRDDLDYDRTVAWKYLEKLTQKHIFEKVKYGNPSRYRINEIFLSFYEDRIKKSITFK